MWFFIEDDISGTIKAFNTFTKDDNKKESHPIRGGAMEGLVYDTAGLDDIGKLPSKTELIAKIAGGINIVPTKLARVVKAPGSKLARAIKLATDEDNESSRICEKSKYQSVSYFYYLHSYSSVGHVSSAIL